MNNDTLHQDRSVRVYISSSFRDMNSEREELIRNVFPQLRELCEQRDVTFVGVDLHWGTTQEQAERGGVLSICLAEIDRCRPYFVGLLGERYGWVPDEIPLELVQEQPWLAEFRDRSINELEILHGLLNNLASPTQAYLYFRDPQYLARLPKHRRLEFVEQNDAARQKMAALKHRIRQCGVPLRENYSDPTTLGQWVLHDLIAAINREFPPEALPDPLDRAAAQHRAFARSRTQAYVAQEGCFQQLDAHAAETGPPVVIVGEAGSGKSALLANWSLHYGQTRPADFVLVHFLDAGSDSSDWTAMLRRIMEELKRRFDIEHDVPTQPAAIRTAFPNWLDMASSSGRVVLVLDGLDRLPIRDGAADLVWLPAVLPSNIRLIVSSLPGRSLDELAKRGWPKLQIMELSVQERVLFIEQYFTQYVKRLSRQRVQRIAESRQAGNPLHLRLVLDELRVLGTHENLDDYIERYLEATTLAELYKRIFSRYEHEYVEFPTLARDALSLLGAAPEGIFESELLELLGEGDQTLPRIIWSPLSLALDASVVPRRGKLCLANDQIRNAIRNKYLSGSDGKSAHEKLARKCHQRLFDQVGDKKFRLTDKHPQDVSALKYLPYHACESGIARIWNATMTDFAYLHAVVSRVDVTVGWAPDGNEIAWHEGYFVIMDEIRKWLSQTGATSPQSQLSQALLQAWECHPEFVKSAEHLIPTLYEELKALDSTAIREVPDRATRQIKLKGGPLWSWCERERAKYESTGELWNQVSTEASEPPRYAAFISYRREGGAESARLIREILLRHEQRAFLDVVDLGSYHFDERILTAIEQAPNFLVVLTPKCLERCVDEGDWLRREIAHACETDRNVIPILKDGFDFPENHTLPSDISDLPRYNAVVYSQVYVDATIDKIISFFS